MKARHLSQSLLISIISCVRGAPGDLLIAYREHADNVWSLRPLHALTSFDNSTASSSQQSQQPLIRTWLFSASEDHSAKQFEFIWNLSSVNPPSLRFEKTFIGHQGGLGDCVISPDMRHLYTGAADTSIRQWSINSRLQLRSKSGGDLGSLGEVWTVALASDLNLLFTGHGRGYIGIWNLTSLGRLGMVFTAHSDSVRAMEYHGGLLFSASYDNFVRIWRWNAGQNVLVSVGEWRHTDMTRCLVIDKRRGYVYSGGDDNSIRRVQISFNSPNITVIEGTRYTEPGAITSLALSHDALTLFSGTFYQIREWDLALNTVRRTYAIHRYVYGMVSVQKWLLAVAEDYVIRVWETGVNMDYINMEVVSGVDYGSGGSLRSAANHSIMISSSVTSDQQSVAQTQTRPVAGISSSPTKSNDQDDEDAEDASQGQKQTQVGLTSMTPEVPVYWAVANVIVLGVMLAGCISFRLKNRQLEMKVGSDYTLG